MVLALTGVGVFASWVNYQLMRYSDGAWGDVAASQGTACIALPGSPVTLLLVLWVNRLGGKLPPQVAQGPVSWPAGVRTVSGLGTSGFRNVDHQDAASAWAQGPDSSHRDSSSISSRVVGGRSFGPLARQRRISASRPELTGRPSRLEGVSGVARTCFMQTSITVSPTNTGPPVSKK
jgi:hypothetical protein